jgi:hypothetical protein
MMEFPALRHIMREKGRTFPGVVSCIGYLDHPFKNKHVETEKDLHPLLANTGGWV